MRCSLGQSWSGNGCDNTPAVYTWQNALLAAKDYSFASHSDWRLPNIKELISIVEERCYSPSINVVVFPSTPSSAFWTSSKFEEWGTAFIVNFNNGGESLYYHIENNVHVRLVRSGQ
ncbi:Lcl C-terminal domain-containing protein [Alishewanella longhuensis]